MMHNKAISYPVMILLADNGQKVTFGYEK